MRTFRCITLLLIFAALLSSCSKKKSAPEALTGAFEHYIQAHSNGLIGSTDPVVILLKQEVGNYQPGDELPAEVVSLSPAVKGQVVLTEPSRIEFIPTSRLKNGEDYTVTFRLGKVFSVAAESEEYRFDLSVIPLEFTVLEGRLSRNQTAGSFRYEGKIQCSDLLDASLLDGIFTATLGTVDLALSLENINPRLIQYAVNGITQADESQNLRLTWNGRKAGLDEKGELEVRIPGKNEFSVLHVQADQGDNQMITLTLSDAPDSRQELKGLVYLEGSDDFALVTRGEELFIYPGSRLDGEWTVIVSGSLKSNAGVALGESQRFIVTMSPLPPEVSLQGGGYIMPDAGGLFLPFKTVGLRGVDLYVYKIFSNNIRQFFQQNDPADNYSLEGTLKYVGRPVFKKTIRLNQDPKKDLSQWNTWSVDLSQLVRQDPHALYHVEFRIRQNLVALDCGGQLPQATQPLEMIPEEFSAQDLQGYQDARYYYEDLYPDEYDWRERDNPCHPAYYNPSRFIHTNVLATNLGIMVKSGNQKDYLVAVTDLITAEPVSNASVQFYNFQQQQIIAGMTDPDGLLEITLPQVPFLVEVSKEKQKAYLRIDDGSALSLSNFDVTGEQVEDGVKGMIYGERGVWRPGDTLFLSFALFDRLENLPDDLPVLMEVVNAQDQLVYKKPADKQVNGFYSFQVPTHPDDPTGIWRATVKVGALEFSKRLRIETVRPNRLKMNLVFNRSPLLPDDANQQLNFSSEWLHGAPAANLRAEIQLSLRKTETHFEGFQGYSFDNPLKDYWPDEFTLFNGLLDNRGAQKIPLYLENAGTAPGMLQATFISRVYESGGGFSTDVMTTNYSPYSRYVGVSVAGGKPGEQLTTDTSHLVRVATVDPSGKPVSCNGLIARVYKVQWRWWWSAEQNDLAWYLGSEYEKLVFEKPVKTTNGQGSFSFRINYPDWGRYLVHVMDPETGHGAGQVVYIDWPAWTSREGRANPSGATMLTFTADREEYKPGDKAVLTFPSMKNARALLTIEAGEKILDARWIKTDAGESQVEVGITPDMAPNVYAALTLVQAHEHPDNDLPIRQYGVLRLNVSDPDSHLEPKIDLPAEIRPNSTYTIKVSEAHGKPMTYTLAIVDEGLLNLTRFKTPDPWKTFYAQEALGVKTWDYFDAVMGAYGGRLESLLAIGGDEGEVREDAKKANRFIPVVTYLGPFELKKNKKDSHEIQMPNYIGEVRAMVVAGSPEAWGSAEAAAKVRQPLMVLTTLPRRLAVEDEIDLPVSVFVMDDKIREVTVTINPDGQVKAVGGVSQKLAVSSPGEYTAVFKIKAASIPGPGKIIAGAISGKETASTETEIDVLNPNPMVFRSKSWLLEAGQQATIPIEFFGSAGTNSGTLTVSGLPSFGLRENLNYLLDYPYGCLEQITSAAFAQLILGDLTELSEEQALTADRNIRAAIRKLANYQLPSGGFSLWPGTGGANLWATSWAGHFMLKAKEKGYVIPGSMLNNWIKFQQARVDGYSRQSDYQDDSDQQQAYRLYTLVLAGERNMPAMNRLRESGALTLQAAWRLAAAYASAGRTDAAEQLVQDNDRNRGLANTQFSETFGSSLRDQAMILETLVLLKHDKEAFTLAKTLLTDLRVGHYSTQTTAYTLLAVSGYARGKTDQALSFTIEQAGKKDHLTSQKTSWTREYAQQDAGKSVVIASRGENPVYVEFTACGQPEMVLEPAASNGLILKTEYTDLDGNILNPKSIPQGSTFLATVTITNPVANGFLEHLAVSQIMPSIWEILSTRYATENDEASGESAYVYRDIRDDRVNTFFSLSGGESAVFNLRINAAFKGSGLMPGVLVEDMYQPGRMAVSEGMRVNVR